MKKIIISTILLAVLGISPNTTTAQLTQSKIENIANKGASYDNLDWLSIGDLWLVRNYIFAKHGYKFKNEKLGRYYSDNFDFEPSDGDINSKLTDKEKDFIKKIRARENALKAKRKVCQVGDYQFQLKDGKLIYPAGVSGPYLTNPDFTYLSAQKLSNQVYIVKIESDFYIDIIECCGGEGARNKVLQQYLFYPSTKKWVPIPMSLTEGKYVRELFGSQYMIVMEEYLSGAPGMQIVEISTFKEILQIDEFRAMEQVDGALKVWEYTDKEAEYPYKYQRAIYFKKGVVIKTNEVEKVDASGYYAG